MYNDYWNPFVRGYDMGGDPTMQDDPTQGMQAQMQQQAQQAVPPQGMQPQGNNVDMTKAAVSHGEIIRKNGNLEEVKKGKGAKSDDVLMSTSGDFAVLGNSVDPEYGVPYKTLGKALMKTYNKSYKHGDMVSDKTQEINNKNMNAMVNYLLDRQEMVNNATGKGQQYQNTNDTVYKQSYGGTVQRYSDGGALSAASGALGGGMTGAQLGSTFGPWGTVIGGGLGAIGGGISSYLHGKNKKSPLDLIKQIQMENAMQQHNIDPYYETAKALLMGDVGKSDIAHRLALQESYAQAKHNAAGVGSQGGQAMAQADALNTLMTQEEQERLANENLLLTRDKEMGNLLNEQAQSHLRQDEDTNKWLSDLRKEQIQAVEAGLKGEAGFTDSLISVLGNPGVQDLIKGTGHKVGDALGQVGKQVGGWFQRNKQGEQVEKVLAGEEGNNDSEWINNMVNTLGDDIESKYERRNQQHNLTQLGRDEYEDFVATQREKDPHFDMELRKKNITNKITEYKHKDPRTKKEYWNTKKGPSSESREREVEVQEYFNPKTGKWQDKPPVNVKHPKKRAKTQEEWYDKFANYEWDYIGDT